MKTKQHTIKRKALVIFALVAVMFVLHAFVTSNPTMAELAFTDAMTENVVTTINETSVETSSSGVSAEVSDEMTIGQEIADGLSNFFAFTGFKNATRGNIVMILVAFFFIFLAIKYEFEPMLLIPIGVGIIVGNIPFLQTYTFNLNDVLSHLQELADQNVLQSNIQEAQALMVSLFGGENIKLELDEAVARFNEMLAAGSITLPQGMDETSALAAINEAFSLNIQTGIYQKGSVLNYLYFGVRQGIYPPLIFLGIGAMTDFSSLISQPRLMILGAAAQLGVFLTFIGALYLGFDLKEAGAIGIIGGADGPTAIFLSSKMAPHLLGPIAIAAYSYMALVPLIQPPIMRLLTTPKERVIHMKPPRAVSKTEKVCFPIVGLLLTTFISPSALPLLGMLFFGNLLKESGVTKRLANTASNALIDIVTILLGLTVGASTQADVFLTKESLLIFGLGALSFMIATAAGILGAKFMNLFLKEGDKINPLIGNAGVSAVPDSARVSQVEGQKYDPSNHLLMHAMAPNVSGVIGSAVAAGILMSYLML